MSFYNFTLLLKLIVLDYFKSTKCYLELFFLILSFNFSEAYKKEDFFFVSMCLLSFIVSMIIMVRLLNRQSGSISCLFLSYLSLPYLIVAITIISILGSLVILLPMIVFTFSVYSFILILLYLICSVTVYLIINLIFDKKLNSKSFAEKFYTTSMITFFLTFILNLLIFSIKEIRFISYFSIEYSFIGLVAKIAIAILSCYVLYKTLNRSYYDP